MISTAGNVLLISSMVFALLVFIVPGRLKLLCFNIASILPIVALLLLIYAFITSDFSLKIVFLNSSTLLPNMYKFSACWASHEGSILLWYSLLSVMCDVYARTSNLPIDQKKLAINYMSFIQILFCSFVLFTSNPFWSLSFIPKEGLGLNPMLQDIALAIHPPILYCGIVSYIVSFISGLLMLHYPLCQRQILQISKTFSCFAMASLTLGIGIGAWWAYRELGWGGYWFFDPVENISLLPWISGIMLHHFMLLSLRKNLFLIWTICLSIFCFISAIYGMFIVRSGIISSVHSFAFSPGRGMYIFSICVILTIMSMGVLYFKRPATIKGQYNSTSYMVLLGNMLWLTTLLILILSLIYPIYRSLVDNIEVTIDPEFFKKIYIPLHIPIIILAALAPSWSKNTYKINALILILSAVISFILLQWLHISFVAQIFCFISISLIIYTFSHLVIESDYFSKTLGIKLYAFFFGHVGFGLLVLAITLNSSLSQEIEFVGKQGHKIDKNGFHIMLQNIKFAKNPVYLRQIAEFIIEYPQDIITIVRPENRLYRVENTLSQEVDLYSYLFYDIYAILSRVDKDGIIHAKIHYQPFITFIWLAVAFMVLSFILLLLHKK